MKRKAFSILELLATLILVAMICAAVFGVLQYTTEQSQAIEQRMSRMAEIQYCLDQLMSDIIVGSQNGGKITVRNHSYGWQNTCRITIGATKTGTGTPKGMSIDWVAVLRQEKEDLVLYRRETRPGQTENNLYIPLCEYLYSFRAETLNPDNTLIKDPNITPTLINVEVEMYRTNQPDPEQLLKVNRTFCLKRFRQPDEK
jgi:type II secretory pathway pseudopilin PulG